MVAKSGWKYFSIGERLTIEKLLGEGRTFSFIASSLERPSSSVWYEVNKNGGSEFYDAKLAHKNFQKKICIANERKRRKLTSDELLVFNQKMKEGIPLYRISKEMGISSYVLSAAFNETVFEEAKSEFSVLDRLAALEQQMEIVLDALKKVLGKENG